MCFNFIQDQFTKQNHYRPSDEIIIALEGNDNYYCPGDVDDNEIIALCSITKNHKNRS